MKFLLAFPFFLFLFGFFLFIKHHNSFLFYFFNKLYISSFVFDRIISHLFIFVSFYFISHFTIFCCSKIQFLQINDQWSFYVSFLWFSWFFSIIWFLLLDFRNFIIFDYIMQLVVCLKKNLKILKFYFISFNQEIYYCMKNVLWLLYFGIFSNMISPIIQILYIVQCCLS